MKALGEDIRNRISWHGHEVEERALLVSKWGNSLAVRLPRALVESMGLRPGDELSIVEAGKDVIAVTKSERRKAALDGLAEMKWELPVDYKFDRDEANSR